MTSYFETILPVCNTFTFPSLFHKKTITTRNFLLEDVGGGGLRYRYGVGGGGGVEWTNFRGPFFSWSQVECHAKKRALLLLYKYSQIKCRMS
jgi:hypothetical protein